MTNFRWACHQWICHFALSSTPWPSPCHCACLLGQADNNKTPPQNLALESKNWKEPPPRPPPPLQGPPRPFPKDRNAKRRRRLRVGLPINFSQPQPRCDRRCLGQPCAIRTVTIPPKLHFLQVSLPLFSGIFGPKKVLPEVRPRLGDFVAISLGHDTLVTPTEAARWRDSAQPQCKGGHGSLALEDMRIPLVLCVGGSPPLTPSTPTPRNGRAGA